MIKYLPFLLFSGLAHVVQAQAARFGTLSDSAKISLYTVAPGEEIYSIFGHSALRVSDPQNRIDRCYNYGTFEFDQPNFLLKFCRGKLLYYLNVEPQRGFERMNLQDRRTMREQILNLDQTQKQRLFDLLEENALPENKNYKYDFFYDNCATRIRDIVKECLFHQVFLDSTHLKNGTSMRDLLKPYLKKFPWTDFGIDLVLGTPADRTAQAEQYMFLPDFVHDVFGKTKLDGGKPLVSGEEKLPKNGFPEIEERKLDWVDRFFANPLWVMCFVALIGLLSMASPKTEFIFDTLFWFVLGLAGLVMLLLWVATDHSATKFNLNLLWALPTHLFFFGKKRESETTENYFVGAAILAGLALVFWKILPQAMPVAAIPLAILVVIKGLFRRYWVK